MKKSIVNGTKLSTKKSTISNRKSTTRSSLLEHLKAQGATNGTRNVNLEGFIANHKEEIVHLLKGIILPKLKARALQQKTLDRDSDGNLDKEAMNYELGYFLGLQKAFKKNPYLNVENANQKLAPIKLGNKLTGLSQALSKSEPMTGYTSVTFPYHRVLTNPVHENVGGLLARYGVKDPGFVRQLTKATDGNDILEFAGKHHLDVFAERKNMEGISDYLAKR